MPNEIRNKPNSGELAPDQRQPSNLPQMAFKAAMEIYQGPLPDPETLLRYKDADPSFPDRIVKMAENHNAADVGIKKSIYRTNIIVPIAGQVFTFLLGIGSLYACIHLADKGYNGGAITAVIAGFAPIIINAIKGLRRNSHPRNNDQSS